MPDEVVGIREAEAKKATKGIVNLQWKNNVPARNATWLDLAGTFF